MQKDILLITADSLRADHCGFMGYDRATTPFLSNPPCESIVFTRAVAPSSWTLPSMKAMMTGELFDDRPDSMMEKRILAKKEFNRQTTIPERLAEKNYSTHGLSPNPHASKDSGFDKGFKTFEDFSSDGGFIQQIFRNFGLSQINTLMNYYLGKEGFTTGKDHIERISEHMTGERNPTFIWTFMLDTHIPYQSQWLNRTWSSVLDQAFSNILYWRRLNGTENYGWANFSSEETTKLINLYDDSIKSFDNYINRIWNEIREHDPAIIIVGDHGEAFGEHGFYAHSRELYQELIHVPLVILNYGEEMKVEDNFSLLDLPQLIENMSSGRSVLDQISDRPPVSSVWEGGDRKIAIQDEQTKLIVDPVSGDEVYNISEDPGESNMLNQDTVPERFKRILEEEYHKQELRRIKSAAGPVARSGAL